MAMAYVGMAHDSKACCESICAGSSQPSSSKKIRLADPETTTEWVIDETDFAAGLCGGKSQNLATLRNKAPAGVQIPESLVLPFGTFERVLAATENKQAAADLKSLLLGLVRPKSTFLLVISAPVLHSPAHSGDLTICYGIVFGTFERVLAASESKQAAADLKSLLSGLVCPKSLFLLFISATVLQSPGHSGLTRLPAMAGRLHTVLDDELVLRRMAVQEASSNVDECLS